MTTNPQTALSLRHVGVSAGSLDDFCQVMEDAFRLKVRPEGADRATVNLGKQRLVVTQASEENMSDARKRRGLDHLVLAAPDPDALAERLADAGLLLDQRTEGRRTRFVLSPDAWSGVPIQVTDAADLDDYHDPDRNVVGIDHIGVATRDNELVRHRFCDLLRLEVESLQTDTEATFRVEQFTSDKYGVRVASSQSGSVTGLRVMFVTLGDFELEFLQDLRANAESGASSGQSSSTAGDQGAISSYVERHGPGLHHIALRVQDIDQALKQAESGGVQLIDRAGRPGSRRAQIAFMQPRSTGGVLFHFVQRPADGKAWTE